MKTLQNLLQGFIIMLNYKYFSEKSFLNQIVY